MTHISICPVPSEIGPATPKNESLRSVGIPHIGRLRSRVAVLLFGLLTLSSEGCSPKNDSAQSSATADPSATALPEVSTTRPVRRTLVQKTIQPGRIEAFSTTPIHAKITGYVDQLNVDIGDRVKGPVRDEDGNVIEPGQLLALLSAPELDEEFHQKEAVVEQVRAEILQAEAAVKVAMSVRLSAAAGVEESAAGQQQATANFNRWKSEYDRIQALADAKTVTPKLADEAELQFRSAMAGRAQADARLKSAQAAENEAAVAVEKAQADLLAMKSRLKVAEADRERVDAMRNYLQIRAPFNGIITERRIDAGHLVHAAGSSAEKPLFVLIQADTVRLFIDVPESDASLVEPGRAALITIPAMGNTPIEGIVARTGWALQSGTRSLNCEIDVPNPEGRLRPGMYALVELVVAERSDALTVPASSIVTGDGRTWCVSVTEEGSILRVAVQTGIRSSTHVEIISGLNGTEDLLTANAAAFTDGQLVEKSAR